MYTVEMVTFIESGSQRAGVELSAGGNVADITFAGPPIPTGMLGLLSLDGGIDKVVA